MSIFIRVCRSVDYEKIRLITNEAFMHDAFFKKEEYVVRFGKDSVTDYMSNPQSTFLVAEEKNELVGSIYLKWTVDDDQITGNFSAVSVPDKCTRRGIGRRLVAAAEQYILDLEGPEKRVLEAGVISLREDLFKWYGRQGFSVVREFRDDPEVNMISKPGLEVFLAVISKALK